MDGRPLGTRLTGMAGLSIRARRAELRGGNYHLVHSFELN